MTCSLLLSALQTPMQGRGKGCLCTPLCFAVCLADNQSVMNATYSCLRSNTQEMQSVFCTQQPAHAVLYPCALVRTWNSSM